MTLFQITVLVFIFFVCIRIIGRYRDKVISSRELFLWGLLWVSVALMIIWPGTTSFLASQLGIGRGVDLVIYIALILNLYLIFKLFLRQDKTDKNLTELVRQIALKNANLDKDQS